MTLNDLFLEYAAKRSRNMALAAARKEHLLKKHPVLEELLAKKNDICLAQIRDTLLHPAEREAIAAAAKEDLAQTDAQISKIVSAEDLASMETAFDCPVCKDTGYDDRGRRKLCSCMVKRIYADLYGGIPTDQLKGRFSRYREDLFKTPQQQRQAKAVRLFAEKYADGSVAKPLLIFMGSAGLGKSFTMGCIANKMAETRENILFIDAFSMFQVFHQARLIEEIPLDPIYDADVLMIDDLGTEPMTVNVTQEQLFRLLEYRTRKNHPTVISTNMTSTQLKERYTEKVSSRLFAEETSSVLRLEGEDIRL